MCYWTKKSMCLYFERPKLKMSEFGVKKVLSIEKVPTKKIGDLRSFRSILLTGLDSGFFRARENRYVVTLVGQVLIGEDLGTWPFMIKRLQQWISLTMDPQFLKEFWCSSSDYVLVFWLGMRGETLVPGEAGGQSSFLCTYFTCMTYSPGLLSPKNNSAPHQTG